MLLLIAAAGLAAAQQVVQFKDHVVEANARGGYAVLVADLNKDGKPDIIGISQQIPDLTWYENPTWTPHVIVKDMRGQVNLAIHDIDGDGIPELALENGFAMQQDRSPGYVWLLAHQGDPRELWKATKVDEFPTSHHIAWADVDGDGKKELINAPLVGATNKGPKYEGPTPLFFYRVPKDWSGPWKRETITENLSGITHRVRVANWSGKGKRDDLLLATFEGVLLYSASGKGDKLKWDRKVIVPGHNTEEAPRLGTSDIKIGHLGKHRMLATVEPWHGNEVVVYTEDGKGGWKRNVIYNTLTEGHEVCVGDFNGDGRDEIVAGDRARGKIASSHVFYSTDDTGTQWHHEELDHNGMSASGCEIADFNHDGRPDIVMIGGATHNIKVYENAGPITTTAAK
jgi:hypothetical protein